MSRAFGSLFRFRGVLIALSICAVVSTAWADEGGGPSARSLYERGIAERRAGQTGAAMVLLALAAAREPDNADIRLQLALAQMAAKRVDAAERELLRALRLAPGYADAEIALGYVDLFLGRRLQGDARARRLLRRYPEREDVILLAARLRPPVKPVSNIRAVGLRLRRFDGSMSPDIPSIEHALRRDAEVGIGATSVRLRTP